MPSAKSEEAVHDASGPEEKCRVQVVVRCRPLNGQERSEGTAAVVRCDGRMKSIDVQHKSDTKRYTFDNVYGQYTTQEEIFNKSVKPIVQEVLQGFSCTVFAYGQTGTGKTFTMEGAVDDDKARGIIPRAVQEIFATLSASDADYTVRVSYLELYNEQLEDLLVKEVGDKAPKLRLNVDAKYGVCCHGLQELHVQTPEELYKVMRAAQAKRKTAETLMNKQSSRSHCVFTLKIHTKETTAEGEDLIKVGKLHLVDLAGSECAKRSGATAGSRKRELKNINKSLLTLGRVITSLVSGQRHIPYRDSKLTRLLQESLGGRAKTCIIATCSPSVLALDETMSTLEYASKAKNIKNRPQVNKRMTKRGLLKEYASEIEQLKVMLEAARDKNGVFLPKAEFEQMTQRMTGTSAQVEELERVLASRLEEMTQLKELCATTQAERDTARADAEAQKAALCETRATLATTEADLSVEQRKCGETAALLDDATVTKAKLRTEAETNLSSLRTTAADVEALHAKVARVKDVEASNQQSAAALESDLKSNLATVTAAVADFCVRRKTARADLLAAVAAEAEAATAAALALRGQLDAALAAAAARGTAATAAATEHAAAVKSDIEAQLAADASALKAVAAAVAEAEAAAADAASRVAEALDVAKDKAEAWAVLDAAARSARGTEAEAMVAAEQGRLSGIEKNVQQRLLSGTPGEGGNACATPSLVQHVDAAQASLHAAAEAAAEAECTRVAAAKASVSERMAARVASIRTATSAAETALEAQAAEAEEHRVKEAGLVKAEKEALTQTLETRAASDGKAALAAAEATAEGLQEQQWELRHFASSHEAAITSDAASLEAAHRANVVARGSVTSQEAKAVAAALEERQAAMLAFAKSQAAADDAAAAALGEAMRAELDAQRRALEEIAERQQRSLADFSAQRSAALSEALAAFAAATAESAAAAREVSTAADAGALAAAEGTQAALESLSSKSRASATTAAEKLGAKALELAVQARAAGEEARRRVKDTAEVAAAAVDASAARRDQATLLAAEALTQAGRSVATALGAHAAAVTTEVEGDAAAAGHDLDEGLAKRSAADAAASQGLTELTQDVRLRAQDVCGAVRTTVSSASVALGEWRDASAAAAGAEAEASAQCKAALLDAIAQGNAAASEAAEQAATHAQGLLAEATSSSRSRAEALATTQNGAAQFVDSVEAATAAATAAAKKVHVAAGSSLDDVASAVARAGTVVDDAAAAAAEAFEQHEQTHAKVCAVVHTRAATFVEADLRADVPTGTTPAKRLLGGADGYSVVATYVADSDPAAVLRAHHARRAEAEMTGKDEAGTDDKERHGVREDASVPAPPSTPQSVHTTKSGRKTLFSARTHTPRASGRLTRRASDPSPSPRVRLSTSKSRRPSLRRMPSCGTIDFKADSSSSMPPSSDRQAMPPPPPPAAVAPGASKKANNKKTSSTTGKKKKVLAEACTNSPVMTRSRLRKRSSADQLKKSGTVLPGASSSSTATSKSKGSRGRRERKTPRKSLLPRHRSRSRSLVSSKGGGNR